MSAEPRPEDLLDQPVPDLALPGSDGRDFPLRGGPGATVLFFYLRNASPG